MSALLLTAEVVRLIRGASAINSIIVIGAPEADAVQSYQEHLEKLYADPQDPIHIERLEVTPLFDKVLTETEAKPLESALISAAEKEQEPPGDAEADMGAGWWADCDQLVRPNNLPPDLDAFRRSLPADIQSDLNWNSERKHAFIIRVLPRTEEDKPLAALVQASNAPLAAWLWRHHAQGTPVSHHPIVVEPCCPIVKAGEQPK